MSDATRPGAGAGTPASEERGRGADHGRPGGDRSYGDRSYGDRDGRGGPRPEPTVKSRLRARARKKARKGRKRMFQRRKVCRFCADKRLLIDYKEPKTLRLFISETGKMTPSRISGNCAKHQRRLASAIKRARHIAFLPYAPSHM